MSPASLEEVQVHDTNYTTFALMSSRKQSGSQLIVRVYLLCEPLALWAAGGWGGGTREAGGTPGPGATLGRGRPPLTAYPQLLRATLCSWAPGRMWAIETQVLSRFFCLVRAHGLSEDHVVFPDLTGREQLEDGVGWHYSDGASASGAPKPYGSLAYVVSMAYTWGPLWGPGSHRRFSLSQN